MAPCAHRLIASPVEVSRPGTLRDVGNVMDEEKHSWNTHHSAPLESMYRRSSTELISDMRC